MSDTGTFSPPAASALAGSYDFLFIAMIVMTLIISLGIAAFILYFAVKYRRRHADDFGKHVPDHTALEITWTAIPLLICLVIFGYASHLYFQMTQPPANALIIQVTGKQWMWKLQHSTGRKEINELHLPLGRPIKLIMTSEDVIHSFFIPAFRMKQDVLPGRYTQEWFTPTKLGEYDLLCSEYCGTSHSHMRGHVIVMRPLDYDQWAQNAALDDRPEIAGARLFSQYGCIACHGQQAPTLSGIYESQQPLQDGARVFADEDYLRESILYPRAKIVAGYPPIMPSYEGQLSEDQLYQLIAYIKSLKTPVGPPPAPTPNGLPVQGIPQQ